jgi:hypothetical protein
VDKWLFPQKRRKNKKLSGLILAKYKQKQETGTLYTLPSAGMISLSAF